MIAFEMRALLALTPLSVVIDRYSRLPTQLLIWVWVAAALLPTSMGVQTLTPAKTPTHNIRMVGPGGQACVSRRDIIPARRTSLSDS